MATLHPFQNEKDTLQLGDLTIENRLDRLELYGSLQITKNKSGLAAAKALKQVIDATVVALEKEELPAKIAMAPKDSVKNPFK